MNSLKESRREMSLNLKDIFSSVTNMFLEEKTSAFLKIVEAESGNAAQLYRRIMASPAGRVVKVLNPFNGELREMLMFGSNNYLGLANHPYVVEQVRKTIDTFGVGIGGPPMLNGYTTLHRELEERLADLKEKQSAIVFSSGYGANVGLVTGLVNHRDFVLYDEFMHTSFCDGLKMGQIKSCNFRHNDPEDLEKLLGRFSGNKSGDIFVAVEGVYSMTGEIAPLDKAAELCKRYGAYLIVDDAHGTGVLGNGGRGTAHFFGVQGDVPIIMGTFSKAFGMTGGFVCSSREIVEYLRYFARSYAFSASLPPVVISALLAGLDVMSKEPELLARLHSNIAYAVASLNKLSFSITTTTAIIALPVPKEMNLRKAAREFHEQGIFINSVEYPAVPLHQQRFRISIMATHTKEDIDRLVETVEFVWKKFGAA